MNNISNHTIWDTLHADPELANHFDAEAGNIKPHPHGIDEAVRLTEGTQSDESWYMDVYADADGLHSFQPTEHGTRTDYATMGDLIEACRQFIADCTH